MNVIIPLAFLSYYRYSFFLVDFVVFLLICFAFYQMTHKIMPLLVPEQKQEKFQWVRKILDVLLGLQLFCYLFLLPSILFQPPLLVHFKTQGGISGIVFVLSMILRLINILLVSGFLTSCWMLLEKQDRSVYVKRWFFFMSVLLLYYLFTMFYILFPTMNKALDIYEMFYNIRNLYLVNDPEKKYKTFLYLQQMGCLPAYYSPLYKDEWKRTFQNPVAPLECSFS